jgi:hypothetical protein
MDHLIDLSADTERRKQLIYLKRLNLYKKGLYEDAKNANVMLEGYFYEQEVYCMLLRYDFKNANTALENWKSFFQEVLDIHMFESAFQTIISDEKICVGHDAITLFLATYMKTKYKSVNKLCVRQIV